MPSFKHVEYCGNIQAVVAQIRTSGSIALAVDKNVVRDAVDIKMLADFTYLVFIDAEMMSLYIGNHVEICIDRR